METQNNFVKLASIDVGEKVEKKNGLSYLSWAWAVDQLLRQDPQANWEFHEPKSFGQTMMVACTVTAFGIARTCHLPVMDYKNKAIANPDAFAINTAMQRCLVKAIALHGLGLYIYAGEDLPYDNGADERTTPQADTPSSEHKARSNELVTMVNAQPDQIGLDSFIDQHSAEIEALPDMFRETVEQQIYNRSEQIKNGVHPVNRHTFAGVQDAIDWMKRMQPVVQNLKTAAQLKDWQAYNQPFINGLDILKAEKYLKDGKLPRERFIDLLADRLSTLEKGN